jgi:DNA mismatch endonuclease (patch repair protein)
MTTPSGSWATSERVRRVMTGTRSRDTNPELAVRRAVHAMGLRYRVNTRPLPAMRRSADLIFPREKVAVMVDGCYWHGCPEHYVASKSNTEYWSRKVEKNRLRDAETDSRLRAAGWLVIRIWEHQDPHLAAEAVRHAVHARKPVASNKPRLNSNAAAE